MRFPRAFLFVPFLIFCLLIGSQVSHASEHPLPESWYHLPEDGFRPNAHDPHFEHEQIEQAGESLDLILKSSSNALDQLENAEKLHPALQAHRGNWGLRFLSLDLGVSVSGVLGVMLAKGEATATLLWRRSQSSNLSEEGVSDEADVSILGEDSTEDILKKMEPLVRATLATQQIHNEKAFRDNLLKTVLSYQSMVQKISVQPEGEFFPSRLRLDLSVNASGMVQPATTVGGDIRLRFEWFPCHPDAKAPHCASTRDSNPIEKLLLTLTHELQGVSYHGLEPSGFELSQLKFSLGVYGNGQIGVIKAGASVAGHLYMDKRKFFHPIELEPSALASDIPLIETKAPASHLQYAKSKGITFEHVRFRDETATVYHIPRETFRKGLQKAVDIGSFFAEHSNHSAGKKWELFTIKAEFALSLGGSVGVVSLGGTGSLQLIFTR